MAVGKYSRPMGHIWDIYQKTASWDLMAIHLQMVGFQLDDL